MKLIAVCLSLFCVAEGAVQLRAYQSGNSGSPCIKDGSSSIRLICTVDPLSQSVRFKKNGVTETQCSNAVDICIPTVSATDPRYTFSSDVSKKEFYFNISAVGDSDKATILCDHGGSESANVSFDDCPPAPTSPEPECCCCCICCFIVLIVSVAIGILFTGGHIGFTWADHEYSVKKILSENNKTKKTTEAVCLKDYVIKAVLPECCICLVVIIVQIAVYFAALKKDCNEHCDDCCDVIICLVVTIIVSVVKDAIESGIIYLVVHVKGRNYIHQGGNVDKGDSACCRPNNSILPICAGDDQHPSDEIKRSHRPRGGDDRHQSDEPKSNTTNSASCRAQPPLPEIRSEKKNTRGLSANINDSDINPSYEKKRLTPIGQESQPGWEEKTDRSEDGKEKKKKRKSRDQERDSNVTESADL